MTWLNFRQEVESLTSEFIAARGVQVPCEAVLYGSDRVTGVYQRLRTRRVQPAGSPHARREQLLPVIETVYEASLEHLVVNTALLAARRFAPYGGLDPRDAEWYANRASAMVLGNAKLGKLSTNDEDHTVAVVKQTVNWRLRSGRQNLNNHRQRTAPLDSPDAEAPIDHEAVDDDLVAASCALNPDPSDTRPLPERVAEALADLLDKLVEHDEAIPPDWNLKAAAELIWSEYETTAPDAVQDRNRTRRWATSYPQILKELAKLLGTRHGEFYDKAKQRVTEELAVTKAQMKKRREQEAYRKFSERKCNAIAELVASDEHFGSQDLDELINTKARELLTTKNPQSKYHLTAEDLDEWLDQHRSKIHDAVARQLKNSRRDQASTTEGVTTAPHNIVAA
jgi:hypothetical protein